MARKKKHGAVKLELYSMSRRPKTVYTEGTLRVSLTSNGWPWEAPTAAVRLIVKSSGGVCSVMLTESEKGVYTAELGDISGTAAVRARAFGIDITWPMFEIRRLKDNSLETEVERWVG